VTNKDHHS